MSGGRGPLRDQGYRDGKARTRRRRTMSDLGWPPRVIDAQVGKMRLEQWMARHEVEPAAESPVWVRGWIAARRAERASRTQVEAKARVTTGA